MSASEILYLTRAGITGADLARNPRIFLDVARRLQRDLNRVAAEDDTGGDPLLISRGSFQGTSFAADFGEEQARLREAFVDSELDRLFPNRNVTSRSSTVNRAGVRLPIPGQSDFGPGTGPSAAQLDEILASFRTPLQVIQGGDFGPRGQIIPLPDVVAQTGGKKDPAPTVVTGAGRRRRRPLTLGPAKGTILTPSSDADVGVGGKTILG